VAPWLITTSGWPVLTAHFAGTTARLVDPVMAAAAAAAAVALAGGMLLALLRGRVRGERTHGPSS
jgi:hypothetical protein